LAQVRRVLGPNWLAHPDCREPVVVCGDFNGLPHSKMYREITRHLQDTRRVYQKAPVPPTWMGVARLDYIFTTPGIDVLEMIVPRTHLTRRASDHAPVVVDLQLMPRP
jgi:endonuclease/exonuclease/phosphatase family metal-dependent hydrolase